MRVRISFLTEVSFLERGRPTPALLPLFTEGGRPFPVGSTQTQGSQKGRPASPPKVGRTRRIPGKPQGPSDLGPALVFQGLS